MDKLRRQLGRHLTSLLFIVLMAAQPWDVSASTQTTPEYLVKAAFLYNAPKFVDWPQAQAGSPVFIIGVLGDDPFGTYLDELSNRTIRGKRITIRRFSSVERATDCHVVFIAASEQRRLAALLARLRDLPVLTISDIDGFAAAGGMLELTMDKNRLTFSVNHRQAKRQGFRISSQMLKLAREIVE